MQLIKLNAAKDGYLHIPGRMYAKNVIRFMGAKMFKDYLLTKRQKILPSVTDWSDPHNHLRNEKDVTKLSWDEWFWFNPINYQIVLYSPPILMMLCFAAFAILAFSHKFNFAGGLMSLFSLLMLRELLRKLKNKNVNSKMNLFDVYLRDWIVGQKVR